MKSVPIGLSRLMAAAALALLCLVPVLYGYRELAEQPDALGLLTNPDVLARLARSIAAAALVAAFATAVGTLLGLGWASGRGRLHAVWVVLSLTPLVLPPYLYALAWIEIAGATRAIAPGDGAAPLVPTYSLAGVVVIESLRLAPVAAAAVWLAVRTMNTSELEASALVRGRWATFGSIFVPSRVAILAAAPLLVFLLALSNHAVASLLQVDLYPVDVQTRFSAHYDAAGAYALTVPLLAMGAGLAVLWLWIVRRYPASLESGAAGTGRIRMLPRGMSGGVAGGYILAAVAAPAVVIGRHTASVRALHEAARGLSDELLLSAGVGLASALAAVALALAVAGAFQRKTSALALAALPIAITGPAFGIGLILLWNHAGWRAAVYDSPAVLVLSGAARAMLLVLVVVTAAMAAYPRDLDAAARLAGRSRWARFIGVTLPLAAPAVALALALAFLTAFSDSDTSAMVAPPGATPFAVRIAGLLHYGPSDFIHAASVLAGAASLVVLGLAGLGVRALAGRLT